MKAKMSAPKKRRIDYLDIIGKTFGLWHVDSLGDPIYRTNRNNVFDGYKYNCTCDCWNTKSIFRHSLLNGDSKSCGCERNKNFSILKTTHGKTHHPLYSIWGGMKNRCYDSSCKNYKNYGGRGIIICKEWLNSFETFYEWAINNKWEKGLSIDRTNTNGNYEPSNCSFITMAAQQSNKRTNRFFKIGDDYKTIAEWSRIYNVPYSRTFGRITKQKWDIQKALLQKSRKLNHSQTC